MKRLFIILFFILFSIQSYCQSGIRLKAYAVSTKAEDTNWNWTSWSAVDVVVTLDTDKLVIYLKEPQSFVLLKAIDNVIQTNNASESSTFLAIDDHGKRCNIQIAIKGSTPQLYII